MKVPSINDLVRDKLTEDARLNMVRFFKQHGVVEDAWFWENVYTALPQELRGRVNASLNEIGSLGQTDRMLPREIVETKQTYILFQEVLDSLMAEQGHMSYVRDDKYWRKCDRSEKHLELIEKRICDEKLDWRLELQYCQGDSFCWNSLKRIYYEYDIARIVNRDGVSLAFDICGDEQSSEKEFVHCLMFSIPVEKQRGFFNSKKIFKSAANTIAFYPQYRGLYSPCLSDIISAPPAKNDNLKSNSSWRIKKNNKHLNADEDEWRLLTFWKRAGFIRPFIPNSNPDTIFLFSPEETLITKEEYLQAGELNPYRDIRHSVYDRDLEVLLRE